MAETNLTRLPILDRADDGKLVGMVSLSDLLKARVRNLEEERHRARLLKLRFLFTKPEKEPVEATPV